DRLRTAAERFPRYRYAPRFSGSLPSANLAGKTRFPPARGAWLSRFPGSDQNPSDQLAFFGGADQALVQTLEPIGKLMRVEAHQMKDGRLQVAHGDFVFRDAVAEFVGLTVNDAGLNAAAGHPDRET